MGKPLLLDHVGCNIRYQIKDSVMVTVNISRKKPWTNHQYKFYPQIAFEHTSQSFFTGECW